MSFIKASSSSTHRRPSPEEVAKHTQLLNTALEEMLKAETEWLREDDPDMNEGRYRTYVARERDYKTQLRMTHDVLHRGGTRRHRRKHRKTLRRK